MRLCRRAVADGLRIYGIIALASAKQIWSFPEVLSYNEIMILSMEYAMVSVNQPRRASFCKIQNQSTLHKYVLAPLETECMYVYVYDTTWPDQSFRRTLYTSISK